VQHNEDCSVNILMELRHDLAKRVKPTGGSANSYDKLWFLSHLNL
jgi:hypothetical protein